MNTEMDSDPICRGSGTYLNNMDDIPGIRHNGFHYGSKNRPLL